MQTLKSPFKKLKNSTLCKIIVYIIYLFILQKLKTEK